MLGAITVALTTPDTSAEAAFNSDLDARLGDPVGEAYDDDGGPGPIYQPESGK